jgi:hypothetical protein
MDRIGTVFLVAISVIVLPVLASVYTGTIAPFIHRRVPSFSYEREVFLLWGLLLVAAFAFELVVVILLLKP